MLYLLRLYKPESLEYQASTGNNNSDFQDAMLRGKQIKGENDEQNSKSTLPIDTLFYQFNKRGTHE
jgi:hypothetical protein